MAVVVDVLVSDDERFNHPIGGIIGIFVINACTSLP
jgi:hypothetical protein